jgi:hypothetical protein
MNKLDSFFLQFKHLWRSGQDAHLDLECRAGQAWVGIRVRLGQEPGLQQTPKKQRNRDTQSRQRRQARRAAARGKHEDHHASEAQDVLLASEAHANHQTNQNEAAEATDNSVKAVEVIPVTPDDEFCRDQNLKRTF